MNIFPDRRGQVYQFFSLQLDLHGKRIDFDFLLKILQAGDAPHPHPYPNPPGCEQPALAYADIQRIAQRGDSGGSGFLKPERPGVFLPFNVQSFPLWNLAAMDFHNLPLALPRDGPQVNAQSLGQVLSLRAQQCLLDI